jgi:hypothetical protein
MASFSAAISSASTSAVNLANAFFFPSGLYCTSSASVFGRLAISPAMLLPRSSTSGKCVPENLTIVKNIPYQRIDLDAIHVVELLQRLLNLSLIGLDIADKYERVVLLDLLHRALRVQRVNDDLVVIEPRLMRHRFSRILGRSREL